MHIAANINKLLISVDIITGLNIEVMDCELNDAVAISLPHELLHHFAHGEIRAAQCISCITTTTLKKILMCLSVSVCNVALYLHKYSVIT